jgi:hypothetical protein
MASARCKLRLKLATAVGLLQVLSILVIEVISNGVVNRSWTLPGKDAISADVATKKQL